MNILSIYPLPGISYAHDANACVLTADGSIFASEEERFLRSQHAIGHGPERSALLALKCAGMAPEAVDLLATTSLDLCQRKPDFQSRLRFTRELLNLSARVPHVCLPHHLAHSALSVLTSPFDECLFVTLDGGGDGAMGHWGVFRDNRFRIIERCPLSPGIFFSFVTCLSGFLLFEEGKTMGLAAYGQRDERLARWFRERFRIRSGGASLETSLELKWSAALHPESVDPDTFARHKYLRWRLEFTGDDLSWIDEIPPADIAHTGQAVFEDLLLEIVDNLVRRTRIPRVACAGGAFLNVAGTGRLRRCRPEIAIHVPLAPHDGGLALGAALWMRHVHGGTRPLRPVNPYTGPAFEVSESERLVQEFGLSYDRPVDLATAVASAIASGKVVGWFDGRAEYGARALGARSVLADPRSRTVKARLNQLLKKRDWFMPFAPSILEECGDEYFEDFVSGLYMNVAFRVRAEKRSAIPAAVHADGTCRAHAVSRTSQPRYHELITRFRDLTGVPMLLNTSFNRHGLPMVATPRQAVQHFLEGCVDMLVVDGLVIQGQPRDEPRPVHTDREHLSMMNVRRAALLATDGRVAAACAMLSRAGVDVAVDSRGFSLPGGARWLFGATLEELDRSWLTSQAKSRP